MVVLNLHCWVLTSFWLALKHSWLEFAWACLGGAQILMKFEILEIIGQKGICLISFRLMAPRFRGTGMTSRWKCYLFLSRTVLHRWVWQISKTVVCLSVSLSFSLFLPLSFSISFSPHSYLFHQSQIRLFDSILIWAEFSLLVSVWQRCCRRCRWNVSNCQVQVGFLESSEIGGQVQPKKEQFPPRLQW